MAIPMRKHTPAISSVFLACSSIMGCKVPPPVIVEKPIIIERQVPRDLPPDIVQPCAGRPPDFAAGAPTTNGELLVNRRAWIEYSACLESKLQRVREIQD